MINTITKMELTLLTLAAPAIIHHGANEHNIPFREGTLYYPTNNQKTVWIYTKEGRWTAKRIIK